MKTETIAHDAKVKSEDAADKTGEVLTDAAITSAVKTKFLAEPGVSGLKIDVDTNDHVVTLTGTVKSKAEANKAMAIARETQGRQARRQPPEDRGVTAPAGWWLVVRGGHFVLIATH